MDVVEMKPEPFCSLIDTDVEIDLEQSKEYLKYQQEKEENEKKNVIKFQDDESKKHKNEIKSVKYDFNSSNGYSLKTHNNNNDINETLKKIENENNSYKKNTPADVANVNIKELKMKLLPEPNDALKSSLTSNNNDNNNTLKTAIERDNKDYSSILIKVKDASGKVFVRRFLHDYSLLQLFIYMAIELNVELEKLQFSTRLPTKVYKFSEVEKKTFLECGLNSKTESMFLTIVS
jgi:hypothetical protein